MSARSNVLSALSLAAAALAAPAHAASAYKIVDNSSENLIDKAAVMAVWEASLPEARMVKVYPTKRVGFVSQVEGGIADGACVVTARVVMLPLTSPTRRLVWEPEKISTTFGHKVGATAAQCTELATEKLKEAVNSLVSGLVR